MRLHHTVGHLTSDAFRMSETSRTISERIKTFMPRSSPLTASQQQGLSLYAPHFLLHRDEGLLKPEAVFGQSGPLTVEIGFGMGQSLSRWQKRSPSDCLSVLKCIARVLPNSATTPARAA